MFYLFKIYEKITLNKLFASKSLAEHGFGFLINVYDVIDSNNSNNDKLIKKIVFDTGGTNLTYLHNLNIRGYSLYDVIRTLKISLPPHNHNVSNGISYSYGMYGWSRSTISFCRNRIHFQTGSYLPWLFSSHCNNLSIFSYGCNFELLNRCNNWISRPKN